MVKASFIAPARIQTAIQFPAVLFEGNTSLPEPVEPASRLARCIRVGPPFPAAFDAALNAARPAAHMSVAPSDTLAETVPALPWIWSSVISFVLGSAGIFPSILYPEPAV